MPQQARVPVCFTLRPEILKKIDERCRTLEITRSRAIEQALLASIGRP